MARSSRHTPAGKEPGRSRSRDADLTDSEIVSRLRSGDMRVLGEFIFRFQSLVLGQARRYGIPADERRTWTLEILHDVALSLSRSESAPPRSVAAYLVRVAHHRWASLVRSRARERLRRLRTMTDLGTAEAVCESAASEYSVRATRGPDWEERKLSPALERLAASLYERLVADERQLIGWMSRDVPHNEIAAALGMTRSGASQRVRRLRARLVEAARRYAAGLDPSERDEILRFFRRAEVADSTSLAQLLGRTGDARGVTCATPSGEG
jgi:DNA-directed RNA polymerase specialized sigma24 family protein